MMKNVLLTILAVIFLQTPAIANEAKKEIAPGVTREMAQGLLVGSIRKYKIAEDVTVEDAIESMSLRANILNFKQVADLPLSEQVEAMGEKANYMRILAFCDALIAAKLVAYDPVFAGYLPCRIAAIEDNEGQGWIITLNMDLMVDTIDLPPDLKPLAEKARDSINEMVEAGVNGDL